MCAAAGYGSGGTCTATANNLATIEGLINLAVAETNQAFQNSNIPTRLRLVKTHYDATFNEYEYSWDAALSLIRNNNDGQLDYVHAMRDQYGADFVSMILDIATDCGIGYRPTTPTAGDAFSLVKWSCATGYYSFAHELAHNMGCNHDRTTAGAVDSGIYYGYRDPTSAFRTIMAYNCNPSCKRIQYFSNPSMSYQGRPLGNQDADNASWIKRYLADYANYRQSVGVISYSPVPTSVPVPTSMPTVAPTRPPTNERQLTSEFAGGYLGAEGNMFDIRAKANIYIRNFAVHSSAATSVTVEVWKKKTVGTCIGVTMNGGLWELIGEASFVSNPSGTASILPQGTFPAVFVKAGDIQAFYVTFTASTNYNRYSIGKALGAVFKGNEDLEIFEGYAKKYRFGGDISPRVWNGAIYYEIDNNSSPFPQPTSQPTLQPLIVTTPTQNIEPSLQPIVVPTSAPTFQPTNISPSIQPTSSITIMPVIQPSLPTSLAPTMGQNPITTLVPTSSPWPRQKLVTTFNATAGQAGNMIEIQAIRSLVVTSFDIHTGSMSNITVLVYTKQGTYVGSQNRPNDWVRIVNTTIMGKGSLQQTPIPESSFPPFLVKAGEIYSFYITLTEPKISYSKYPSNSILANDSNLRFLRSSGNVFPFGESYANRLWNGILYYSTDISSSVGDKQR
jgi:Metallo-peptidase family M12B Reprolysin-like